MKIKLLFFAALILFPIFYSSAQYSTTDKKAIKQYQEAELFIKERNFDEAKKLLEGALKKDPAFVETHLRMAGIYLKYADSKNAREHFQKACDLKPNSKDMAGAYFYLGQYNFDDGDFEKAKEYFSK